MYQNMYFIAKFNHTEIFKIKTLSFYLKYYKLSILLIRLKINHSNKNTYTHKNPFPNSN